MRGESLMPTTNMRALVKDAGSVQVRTLPQPKLLSDDDVMIRVELAGLCRTDMYVAEGRIRAADPLILGHEFSGTLVDAGDRAANLSVGDKVTVNPLFSCGQCSRCLGGDAMTCQQAKFLGVDRDGCFAGFAVVPHSSVHLLPSTITFAQAAYAEPVAASLAVLKTGIQPAHKGLILGRNRFSQLMERILRVKCFQDITVCDLKESDCLDADAYDFVIETMASSEALAKMISAVRPGGRIILKSRHYEPVTLRLHEAIKKEPVIHIVNYGSFEEALQLLSSGQIEVQDLVDGTYKLESFNELLKRAMHKEAGKPFFSPWED